MRLFKKRRPSGEYTEHFVNTCDYWREDYKEYELVIILKMLEKSLSELGVGLSDEIREALGLTSARLLAFYQHLPHPMVDTLSDRGGMAQLSAMRAGRLSRYHRDLFGQFRVANPRDKARHLVAMHLVSMLADAHLVANAFKIYCFKPSHEYAPNKHLIIDTLRNTQSKLGVYPDIDSALCFRFCQRKDIIQTPSARVHLFYRLVDESLIDYINDDQFEMTGKIYTFLAASPDQHNPDNIFSEFVRLTSDDIFETLFNLRRLTALKYEAYKHNQLKKVDEFEAQIRAIKFGRLDEIERTLQGEPDNAHGQYTHDDQTTVLDQSDDKPKSDAITATEKCEPKSPGCIYSDDDHYQALGNEITSIDEFLEYLEITGQVEADRDDQTQEPAQQECEQEIDAVEQESVSIRDNFKDWLVAQIGRVPINNEESEIFIDLNLDREDVVFVLNTAIADFAYEYSIDSADITPMLTKANMLYKPESQFEIERYFNVEKVTAIIVDIQFNVSEPLSHMIREVRYE